MMISLFRRSVIRTAFLVALVACACTIRAANTVPSPSAGTDYTVSIQAALDRAGQPGRDSVVAFPAGTFRVGTLRVPAGVTLRFDAKTRLEPIEDKIVDQKLVVVAGDNVRIEGLHYDFAWPAPAGRPAAFSPGPVRRLIYADGVGGLTVSGANVVNSAERVMVPLEERQRRGRFVNPNGVSKYTYLGSYHDQRLLTVENGRDVVLENSHGERLHSMISTINTANVTVRGNRMTSGNYLTSFQEGGESLRHYDNWSRDVKYQVCWFGGSPDPSRKGGDVPLGSANKVYREIKPGDAGYNRNTSGAFDVSVQNNYAEYGNTLAWGNKGRQVVIDGNIARFISDYAYGSEGGENIVFSNNIAINCTAGGIVSMYWGEKLLITGNLLITRHEPWSPEWSWWDAPAKYLGPFVRLHHGPSNPEDIYGAGTVQITGNQFVSELSGRSVAMTIQEGRDVMISGNKFVNARIDKVNEGRLTVMDNEFVSRLPFADVVMSIKGRADAVFIKGNVLRRETPVTQPADAARKSAETAVVPGILFTEDEDGKSTDTAAKTDSPAIVFQVSGPFFAQVQGNFVQGWQDMLAMQPVARFREQTGLIVTGNTTDARLDVPFDGGDPAKLIFKNNTAIPASLVP
jgi:hypothetical protein